MYQFLGGRSLGAEAFAPVSVLLTIHFLVFVVVLLPVEQLIVRRLTLDRAASGVPRQIVVLVAISGAVAVSYAWIGVDSLLRSDLRFVGFVGATIVTHAVFVVARGHLAGWRRFRAYGSSSAAASLVRLAIAGAVLAVRPTASGFAVGLILGPLVVFLWKPRQQVVVRHKELAPDEVARMDDHGLLSGLVLSSAASQVLLLAGPLLVAALGGGEALVSVAFATFTLSRAPLTFGYNLLARVLPPFTEMAARGERSELRAWGRGLGIAAVLLAAVGAAVGWFVGPPLVGFAFGTSFRPGGWVAAVVAAGVVLAAAGLFVGQVLVARGEPLRLAAAWLAGIGGAFVAVLVAGGDPLERTALGFFAGEVVALTALVVATVAVVGRERPGYELAKRSLDIGISIVVMVLTLPLLIVAAAAVKMTSSGPAFFRQERVGRGGHRFAMLKLRTMRADGGEDVFVEHLHELESGRRDSSGAVVGIANDPRVTMVGKYLRASSLDELPNLWNVIRGSMSLVGPRPLVPAEADLIGLEHVRFSVKPGVTGLAQISGRDEIGLEERSGFDARYVSVRSIWFDVRVLARTALAVVRRPGR
ncbi:MAG: sugar transferase [bacterium]|nr:sugar transferase [bacterium]